MALTKNIRRESGWTSGLLMRLCALRIMGKGAAQCARSLFTVRRPLSAVHLAEAA